MEARRAALSILDFVTGFIVFSLATVAIHEYFHANVARMLGGDAVVVYWWLGGYTAVHGSFELWQVALIALSGGFSCFLLYLYLFLWWLEDPSDRNVRVAAFYYMVNQLVYGFLEVLAIYMAVPFPIAYMYSALVAGGLTVIYVFKRSG